ncbi:MAG: hypothetical protein M3Z27_03270 [Actinomycetota bacterium]|nr:hypothetical protein [Actinomycetota bacterium]
MAARELDEDRGEVRHRERYAPYERYERGRPVVARPERPRLRAVAAPAAASPRAARATPAPAPPRAAQGTPAPAPRRSPGTGVPDRRTVTITGRGAERYRPPQRRPTRRAHERPGFRPDRIAMWAVLLCVLMILAATTSSHAAVRPHVAKSFPVGAITRAVPFPRSL